MKAPEKQPPIAYYLQKTLKAFVKLFKQIRQKHLAFIFFVFLSAIAWLIRALSDTYVADIDYPVKYTNLPPNKILSQPPVDKLTLQVQSDGLTIINSRLKIKRPLSYNVNAFALYSLSEDSTSVYTLTRYAKNRLSTELNLSNKNIQILNIKPDTLIFNFSRVRKKKVPVVVQLRETPENFVQQHMLNGPPYAIPDSVEVIGPSYLVDTLKFIATDQIAVRRLSDTTERKVQLMQINRINIPLKRVKVVIPVDEFTESEFVIPIVARNLPDTLNLKTFPRSVEVKSIVTYSNYDKLSPDLFQAYVDYLSINPKSTSRLKIEIDTLPDYIHNVQINPRYVEYLIER